MEFARMDSLSRLFPSDLEFQSGRNFIPLLFEIEIQIEKTVDSYWHNTSREVSVYPDTFISAPFLRFSRQIEFDAIFVFLLPFFLRSTKREENVEEDWNKPNFIPERNRRKHSLALYDRPMTFSRPRGERNHYRKLSLRIESWATNYGFQRFWKNARRFFFYLFFSSSAELVKRRALAACWFFIGCSSSLGLATDSFVRVNGSRASFSRISV